MTQEAGGFLNIFAWMLTTVAVIVGAWQAFWECEWEGTREIEVESAEIR